MKKIISATLTFVILVALLLLMPFPAQAAETEDAAVQTVEVGIPVEERPELFITRSMPTHGEGKIAVFLIEFPDYPNDNPYATREYYDSLYFSGGIETNWGDDMTVAKFYKDQSYGKLNLSGQVFDWYTAKHERSYYDYRKDELIEEAAEYYLSQGVDFSQFDGDGDGTIDAITYHFAGDYRTNGQSSPWYYGVNYESSGEIGDMKFSRLVQVNEDAGADVTGLIVTVCHELMHSLGMPDLYSGHTTFALNRYTDDLMSAANARFINPYTKILLGWVDEVRVITGDMENIRLDVYGVESDDFVIVTDEFDGILDEFFLVAYHGSAVIWHIDARLNAAGTAFLNDNQSYNPRPDKPIHSHYDTFSPYLFIEQLSADPDIDLVLNLWESFLADTSFGLDSVLGPNGMPSSDTHDGRYTGIQINNFAEHDGEYLTFDVTFEEDTTAPVITTKEAELKFQETVSVKFNEHIYAGENWDNIKITDAEGNALDAFAILPHYPNNELEISFRDTSYEAGYRIVIPEKALRDSSGNYLPATVLVASGAHYLFPERSELLPGAGDGMDRDNYPAFFFEHENDVVVITILWNKELIYGSDVEFMRLDRNGKVLTHKVVENPAKPGKDDFTRILPIEMPDGSYIIFSYQQYDYTEYRVVFCLDADGNIKWVNDTYANTPYYFIPSAAIIREGGLVVRMTQRGEVGKAVFIDAETGEIDLQPGWQREATNWVQRYPKNLNDGRILCQENFWEGQTRYRKLVLLNAETWQIEREGLLECTAEDNYYVAQARVNDDGTIILFCTVGEDAEAVLLDAGLNVVKTVPLEGWTYYSAYNCVTWFENDGFCMYYSPGGAMYDEDSVQYHIKRYDRYLNLVWESDEEANFAFFFTSPDGRIMAYRSMPGPTMYDPIEVWLDSYGSEEHLRAAHVHNLTHTEEIPATCKKEGMAEYWYCADCGCYYSGDFETPVTDLQSLVLPIVAHTEVEIPAVAPTCGKGGKTAGVYCSVCKATLVQQQVVPVTGEHEFSDWTVTCAPTCTASGTEQRKCSVCGKKENQEIGATGVHSFGQWTVTTEATAEAEGEEARVCAACGHSEVRSTGKLPTVDEPVKEEPAGKNNAAGFLVMGVAGIFGIGSAALIILKKKK